MNNLPEMWSLVKIEWQFFGTLTFREPSLRECESGKSNFRRLSKFAAFGRQLHKAIDYSPRNFGRRNINCVRLEQGEIGGDGRLNIPFAGAPLKVSGGVIVKVV